MNDKYNQFTEQFSVNELAKLVITSLKKISINATINKIKNPRIEKEKHYYNAKHSNIKKIGLNEPFKNNQGTFLYNGSNNTASIGNQLDGN